MIQKIPASLLDVHELATRFPERKREIFEVAKKKRERDLIVLRESRHLISWHPLHTTKTILVAGIVTFALSMLLSQVVAIGKFYAQAKAWNIAIPIPIIGTQTIDVGSRVPTSTALGIAAQFPAYGWRESLYAALAVMITILLERVIVSIFQWKKVRKLRAAEDELVKDIETVAQWITL